MVVSVSRFQAAQYLSIHTEKQQSIAFNCWHKSIWFNFLNADVKVSRLPNWITRFVMGEILWKFSDTISKGSRLRGVDDHLDTILYKLGINPMVHSILHYKHFNDVNDKTAALRGCTAYNSVSLNSILRPLI